MHPLELDPLASRLMLKKQSSVTCQVHLQLRPLRRFTERSIYFWRKADRAAQSRSTSTRNTETPGSVQNKIYVLIGTVILLK